MANASRDQNDVTTLLGVSNADGTTPIKVYADPVTHRLLVDSAGGGTGTVTSVSVVTANGFSGTVATATTTPAITMQTTITGILKGDGTAISAATAGSDYTALAFKTLAVSGQSSVVAANASDTITFANGANITITTNAGTKTVTIAASGSTGVSSVSGTADRISVNNTDPANPVVDIAATYVGQTSITTLGTIGTGTWAGTAVAVNHGGTGQTSYTDGQLLIGNTTGNTLAKATITQGTGVVITNGNGTISVAATAAGLTVGTSPIASGTNTRILYDNSGILGEYTLTGSGTVVAMQTAPSFLTSITTPSVLATSNGSGSIGASGTAFSNLFLVSTGTINFAAGNVVLTHSTGILTQTAGELRITSANVGTNADSVPTLSSTSTFTSKTLTSPTIQTSPVFAAATQLKLTVPTSGGTATGNITNEFNSAYSSTAIGDLMYFTSSGTWQKADNSTSATTYSGFLGIALSVAASGAAVTVALPGSFVFAAAWNLATVGAPVYMGTAAGITLTAPTTTDTATRIVGYVVASGNGTTKIFFNPSNDWITHT